MKTDAHWEKIGKRPHHGVCVHISSLRSQKSSGIGEFLDLIPLIDWCKNVGFDCIQLLPINDSGLDPSPYNAQSSCALDPIYISLNELGIQSLELVSLNSTQRVLREEVLKFKLPLFKKHFQETFHALSQTADYQLFLKENPWLASYALFKALKEEFWGKHWLDWPPDYALLDPARVDFYSFLQFHAFRQMKQAALYAFQKQIFLIGDISILLNPDSADVWANQEFFDLTLKAGSPPDEFTPLGQDWGFPLFNREAMRKSGFQWWKTRLKIFEQFFNMYRIDHVVGFFRIWAIPKGKKPDEGSYVPHERSLWEKNGRELLEMLLDSSPLLPIAEDLGTVSEEIYTVLKELKICGIKLIRMEKEKGKFIPFEEYDPESMTTVSTHDTPTFELWWRNYPQQSSLFAKLMGWEYDPILKQEQRFQILQKAHHTPSYFHLNLLQEYLALFSELTWLNPEDERINTPGTMLPKNWTYRYRPSLEEISSHSKLAESIHAILKNSVKKIL